MCNGFCDSFNRDLHAWLMQIGGGTGNRSRHAPVIGKPRFFPLIALPQRRGAQIPNQMFMHECGPKHGGIHQALHGLRLAAHLVS
jgi:hypothetical protein